MNTLNNRSEYNDSDILSSYAPSERTKSNSNIKYRSIFKRI